MHVEQQKQGNKPLRQMAWGEYKSLPTLRGSVLHPFIYFLKAILHSCCMAVGNLHEVQATQIQVVKNSNMWFGMSVYHIDG